jgi:hypothetical protein
VDIICTRVLSKSTVLTQTLSFFISSPFAEAVCFQGLTELWALIANASSGPRTNRMCQQDGPDRETIHS